MPDRELAQVGGEAFARVGVGGEPQQRHRVAAASAACLDDLAGPVKGAPLKYMMQLASRFSVTVTSWVSPDESTPTPVTGCRRSSRATGERARRIRVGGATRGERPHTGPAIPGIASGAYG